MLGLDYVNLKYVVVRRVFEIDLVPYTYSSSATVYCQSQREVMKKETGLY